ncbi:MAG: hypothetical protein ACK456_09485 [Pseudanabaenaceae cyanobacterium]|jgi:hypothetical protein
MGLYQFIREQEHRNDLIGELGRWMSRNYGQRPDHNSLAFEIAAQEFISCGNWTKQEALKRLNYNKKLQNIIKVEPRVSEIISDLLKIKNCQGYNRYKEYSRFKSKIKNLVGDNAEKDDVRNSESYEEVIQALISLLPPDSTDLYPEGFPKEIYIDL